MSSKIKLVSRLIRRGHEPEDTYTWFVVGNLMGQGGTWLTKRRLAGI
jgi:hypothetical protein